MSRLLCQFSAFDTLFFRESRPQGSLGISELSSVFPPPVSTLLGAIRTAIGDSWHARHGTQWHDFNNLPDLQKIIGISEDLGQLSCNGPYLSFKNKRLYPAPANLMQKEGKYFLLGLAEPVQCDIGFVHLPNMPKQVQGIPELAGAKPAEDCWLTHKGWQAVLMGSSPSSSEVIHNSQLYVHESRLGIGRDNQRSAVQEGLLYQTRHIRPHPDLCIELVLDGLSDETLLAGQRTVRLGGEGRPASLLVCEDKNPTTFDLPKQINQQHAFCLYNLTPCLADTRLPLGIPTGFQPATTDKGTSVWQGELNGNPLEILSIACTRPLRQGGWDQARHQAKPVCSLLPPGSVLYVRANSLPDLSNAIDAFGRNQWLIGSLPHPEMLQGI